MLPANFEEPTGFKWGHFTNGKGANIRYGSMRPDGDVKGTLVIVGGLREPIEKYFEVIREMTDKGFAVWIMDWHGQGGSDRFFKEHPQRMCHDGYDDHIDTLNQFATKIVDKQKDPFILMGHSMGGHISLRFLKEHDGVFDSAVLTAPMIDISTGILPKPVARMMARFAKAGSYFEKYVPGGSDWNISHEVFKGNGKTSDPTRFKVQGEIYTQKPELIMGDVTYGWVYHSFQSIDTLGKEEYLKAIKTPILMEISGDDNIVDTAAEERASKLIPNCTPVHIKAAKHEIWMERDELRKPFLDKVVAFMEERLNKLAPQPKKPNPNSAPKPPKFG